jgi:glutaminase
VHVNPEFTPSMNPFPSLNTLKVERRTPSNVLIAVALIVAIGILTQKQIAHPLEICQNMLGLAGKRMLTTWQWTAAQFMKLARTSWHLLTQMENQSRNEYWKQASHLHALKSHQSRDEVCVDLLNLFSCGLKTF